MDLPLPTHIRAMYNKEPHEELPADLPSEEDIHFWTHGEDRKDEETVSRMLDLPEDAEEPEDAEDGEISWFIARMIMGND